MRTKTWLATAAVLGILMVAPTANAMEPIAPGSGNYFISVGKQIGGAIRKYFDAMEDGVHFINLLWFVRRT